MKKAGLALLLTVMLCALAPGARASNTSTQTATYTVQNICEISVSGNPAPLTITTATPGSQPTEVSDTSTTYAITTNGQEQQITAAVDSALPAGVTLKINLAAPTGGTSQGDVTLTDSPAVVVSGVGQVAVSGLAITYKLDATVAAGVVASDTRTVTLTVSDSIG